MAILWSVDAGQWVHSTIPDDCRYVVADRLPRSLEPTLSARKRINPVRAGHADIRRLLFVRTGVAASEQWFAVPYPGVRLRRNGVDIATGMAALADRDVLALEGANVQWVFTTERLPKVEHFAGVAGSFCPRCKLELEPGQKVVVCPSCRDVHHQDEADKPCWTYAPTCAHCDCQTGMTNPTYSWTPDEL